MPKLLKFAAKSDPILRKPIPDESNFQDVGLKEVIEDMCYSILPEQLKAANAPFDSAAGMAANQWGISRRVFIYTPDGSGPNQIMEVMINPSYTPHLRAGESEPAIDAAYEGCFSVPLTTGIVNRFDCINATWFKPDGSKVERIMQGWEARVFQHETDHLDGKLYDGRLDHFEGPECVERIIFKDKNEEQQYWETLRKDRKRD